METSGEFGGFRKWDFGKFSGTSRSNFQDRIDEYSSVSVILEIPFEMEIRRWSGYSINSDVISDILGNFGNWEDWGLLEALVRVLLEHTQLYRRVHRRYSRRSSDRDGLRSKTWYISPDENTACQFKTAEMGGCVHQEIFLFRACKMKVFMLHTQFDK